MVFIIKMTQGIILIKQGAFKMLLQCTYSHMRPILVILNDKLYNEG